MERRASSVACLPLCPLVFLLCFCSPASSQMPPASTAPAEPMLRGPEVDDVESRSLVHRDMQGRFQKLEGRPEVAALAQLSIDPEQREAARQIIADRASAIRRHLIDNIDLIKESTDAIRAGDAATSQRLSQELYDRFDPDHIRDPLIVPLSAVLSPDDAVELTRLVDAYWAAWIAAASRNRAEARHDDVQQSLTFELFQYEVASAYESTLRPFQQKIDRICEAVDPTPEQREAIRNAIITYIKDSHSDPDTDARERLASAIYAILTDEQRVRLFAAALASL